MSLPEGQGREASPASYDMPYPFACPGPGLKRASFNEAYALRYLREGSASYRIELFPDCLAKLHGHLIGEVFPIAAERPFPIGEMWLRRT